MIKKFSSQIFSARETRQGRRWRPVLVVFILSLMLALCAWLAMEYRGKSMEPLSSSTYSRSSTDPFERDQTSRKFIP